MNGDFKKEVLDYLKSVNEKLEMVLNHEISEEVHADVYFPEINCAIIFHSLSGTEKNQKALSGPISQAIKIIQLWEDQWNFHNEKIRSKIRSLLGITKRIHGRETKLISIDNNRLMEFLEVNHLNVPIKGKYKYGLEKDQELMAVMSFSKGRQIDRENVVYNSYELLRFCNMLDTTVVGGFSKLLSHFTIIQNPDDVMTYVDCDWSDGQSFLAMGFEYSETIPAFEFWLNTKTGDREYPHLVLKKSADQQGMDSFATEVEKESFLQKTGYIKVYNSGSYKFILKRK